MKHGKESFSEYTLVYWWLQWQSFPDVKGRTEPKSDPGAGNT